MRQFANDNISFQCQRCANAVHYMQNVVGMSHFVSSKFVTAVFGDDRLASYTGIASFDT